jgi:hypothetical protein
MLRTKCEAVSYFSAVATLVKVALRDEPKVDTTVMIATEMPAAMRPYSIAVAPDSSAKKRLNLFMIEPSAPVPPYDAVYLQSPHFNLPNQAGESRLTAISRKSGRYPF